MEKFHSSRFVTSLFFQLSCCTFKSWFFYSVLCSRRNFKRNSVHNISPLLNHKNLSIIHYRHNSCRTFVVKEIPCYMMAFRCLDFILTKLKNLSLINNFTSYSFKIANITHVYISLAFYIF